MYGYLAHAFALEYWWKDGSNPLLRNYSRRIFSSQYDLLLWFVHFRSECHQCYNHVLDNNVWENIVFLNYKWTLKFFTLLTFVSSYSQTYNFGVVSAYEKLSCNVRIYLRWKILKIATWIIYFNYTSFILLPCIKTTSISAWSMIY